MRWISLNTPPKKSGSYIIGHRGLKVVTNYLHPDESWTESAKIGWQKDPRDIGATHWAAFTEVPEVPDRDTWDGYIDGAEIEFIHQCKSEYIHLIPIEPTIPKWQFWRSEPAYRMDRIPMDISAGNRGKIRAVFKDAGDINPRHFLVEVDNVTLSFDRSRGIPFKVVKELVD